MRSFLFRHLRLPIAAVTLVLAMLAITASPGSAHWDYQEQGKDVAITSPDHDIGSVCDVERDGNFVTAVWEDNWGRQIGYAEDGGDEQCSDNVNLSGVAETVRICESVNVGDPPKCSTGNV
jgi:hypothetical protein